MATLKRWPGWPDPTPIFYRLYHDDNGMPLFYSMEDVPGTYIEIDQETFARNSMAVRVRDGRLIEQKSISVVTKLQPSAQGTTCHPSDVRIIVTEGKHQKWSNAVHETY